MAHWLETVVKILKADTADLRELALIAGRDPKTFYRYTRLSDVEVGSQDLHDIIFKGGRFPPSTNIPISDPDSNDGIIQPFSPEAEFGGQKHDMEWYLRFAKVLIATGKTDQTIKLLFEAVDSFPDEIVFWHLLIRTLRHKKYRDALVEALSRAHIRFPGDFFINVRVAQNLIASDNIPEAVGVLLSTIKSAARPEDKAQVLRLLSQADRLVAISVYREIIGGEVNDKWRVRFFADLAGLLFLTHQPEDGMRIVRSLFEHAYKQLRGKFLQLLAYAAAFEELKVEVTALFDKIMVSSTGLPEGVHQFALTLEKTGQRAFAIRTLENTAGKRPDQVVLLKWLSELLWNSGDHEAAIEVLTRLIETASERHGPLKWLVELLLEKNDPERAAYLVLETANTFGTLISAKTLRRLLNKLSGNTWAARILEAYKKVAPKSVAYAVVFAKTLSEWGQANEAEQAWGEVVLMIPNQDKPALWVCRLIATDQTAMSNPWLARTFSNLADP